MRCIFVVVPLLADVVVVVVVDNDSVRARLSAGWGSSKPRRCDKGHGRGISVTEATACIFAASCFRHRDRQVREPREAPPPSLYKTPVATAKGCNHTLRLLAESRYVTCHFRLSQTHFPSTIMNPPTYHVLPLQLN